MDKIKIVFHILVALIICIPLLFMNTQIHAVSEIDNRELTEFVVPSDDYPVMIDAYVKDRIGFRSEMITAFTELNDLLFHEMIHPIYTYGKDGYVFFRCEDETIDTEFIDSFCQYLKRIQDYLEDRNIPFIYCLNPSKATVYSQYLPEGYVYQNLFNTEMIKSLEKYEVNYIQNIDLLIEKSQTEQVYNVKYDAGHWNDLGCFYGTNHLLEKVSEYFPNVQPNHIDDFSITSQLETSLPSSKFSIHELVPNFEAKETPEILNLTDSYEDIRLDNNYRTFSYTTFADETLPDVLFFHGSYYNNGRSKFLQTSFHDLVRVHNYEYLLNFDYYSNIFQPDCVILETAEYVTNRDYFDLETMQTKFFNPPYNKVKSTSHEYKSLSELNPMVKNNDGSELLTLQFSLDSPISYGYFFSNGKEYDLSISGTTAEVTIKVENYTEDATVALFA